VFTVAETYRWSSLLHGINLANDLEAWHAVEIGAIGEQDDDALGAHTHTQHLRVMIELFEFLHLLVVPHDHFVLGPLRVLTAAHQSHDVLLVQKLDDADPSVQVSR